MRRSRLVAISPASRARSEHPRIRPGQSRTLARFWLRLHGIQEIILSVKQDGETASVRRRDLKLRIVLPGHDIRSQNPLNADAPARKPRPTKPQVPGSGVLVVVLLLQPAVTVFVSIVHGASQRDDAAARIGRTVVQCHAL
jgi:hypothetical protein